MNAFCRQIVIWFDDEVARVTPEQLAHDLGVTIEETLDSVSVLEARGFLRRRPNGEFDAVIPGEEAARG